MPSNDNWNFCTTSRCRYLKILVIKNSAVGEADDLGAEIGGKIDFKLFKRRS